MSTRHSNHSSRARDMIANLIRLGSLVAIAIGLSAIVVGAGTVYLNLTAQLELERADRAASQQADRIGDELSQIQTALRDASVVDAARSDSSHALRGALRERGVVNILDVRVLPADIDAIALDDNVLDLTATALIIEAARNDRAEIRVLEPGTPAESLVFAQRLPGDAGILLLRTPFSLVGSLLREHELLDFVALSQGEEQNTAVLSSRGHVAAASAQATPIAGTALVLQWARATVGVPLDNSAAVILGCSGLIVMMVGLLLRRRTRLAHYLRHQPPETRTQPGAGSANGSAHRNRRTAQGTMVMGVDDTHDGSGPPPDEDEPPTLVGRSSDLPDWLRHEADDNEPGSSRR